MKYYFVNLNNNKNVNQTKIKNVKLINSIPGIDECEYESVSVLAYESGSFCSNYMVDVISGTKIYSCNYGLVPNITYSSRIEASEEDIIRIANIYKSLSNDDILRYKNGIREIENESIRQYYDIILKEKEKEELLNSSNNYLTSLIETE